MDPHTRSELLACLVAWLDDQPSLRPVEDIGLSEVIETTLARVNVSHIPPSRRARLRALGFDA